MPPLEDEGPLVMGRTCPVCHADRLRLVLATNDSLYLRCEICRCVWDEFEPRKRVRVRLGKNASASVH